MTAVSEYVSQWNYDALSGVDLVLNTEECPQCENDYNQVSFRITRHSKVCELNLFVGCYTTDKFKTDDMVMAEMVIRDWCSPSITDGAITQDEVDLFIKAMRQTYNAAALGVPTFST